jgi:CBS-domain-containing membrane protein
VKDYLRKWRGAGDNRPASATPLSIAWSCAGAFVGIFAVAYISSRYGVPMMIGSFGASAVLVYAAPDGPLSQPRNLVGGHLVSAAVAVVVVQTLGRSDTTIALAVAVAIAVMLATRTLHPPGGATALIGVDTAQNADFVFAPTLSGALILLLVAVVVNNAAPSRHYPRYWI